MKIYYRKYNASSFVEILLSGVRFEFDKMICLEMEILFEYFNFSPYFGSLFILIIDLVFCGSCSLL